MDIIRKKVARIQNNRLRLAVVVVGGFVTMTVFCWNPIGFFIGLGILFIGAGGTVVNEIKAQKYRYWGA